jgi:hypothetical protein
MAGMRAVLVIVAGVLMVLGVAGCGSDSAGVPATTQPSSGAVLPGGGLSVADAIATEADPPLAVAGWVVVTGGKARLCSRYDAYASKPCVEPSLALVSTGSEENGTHVSLLGAVKGDTFVVSSNVQG